MKRLVVLLLVLCLLLCACGKSADAPAAEPTTPVTEPATAPAAEPEAETPTEPAEPEADPTEPVEEVIYRHPLTGERIDAPCTSRVIASTINNVPPALPQYGISKAEMFYEIETEGNATRALVLFTDLSDVGAIGSVRSARTYFNSIMRSYDGILTHVGASEWAYNAMHDPDGNRLTDYQHIDWANYPNYSYRDHERSAAGYAWEHCLFTTGEMITNALADVGFETSNEAGYDFGLNFSEEVELSGESAGTVTIYFAGGKDTSMVYDEATGLYSASQYGEPWIDAGNGDVQLTFTNVLILKADRIRPEGYNSFYYLEGSGEGYYANGGIIQKIQWHRDSVEDPFYYTFEDGTPITLGVGVSYVGIVTPDCTPVYN